MIDAQELVDGLLVHPWGQVSPSVYETGRVVSLAPWLKGHAERVDFLLGAQGPDGGWGPAAAPGYALVPTLSAVEALLEEGERAAGAVERGIAFLRGVLGERPDFPDMPAIEMLSVSMIRAINERLDVPLPIPSGLDDGRYELVKAAFAGGTGDVPQKFLHALEVLGPDAAGLPGVRPEPTGTVGASPAATAAWLGPEEPDPFDPSRRFLEAAAEMHGGPVAVGLPITVFERGWVLSWLLRAGIPVRPHPELASGLLGAIGPAGASTGAGLPPDADTTAVALYALALLGMPQPPDVLERFETDTCFVTWPGGEDGRSVTTNAHVLEAFRAYARAGDDFRYIPKIEKIINWLIGEQRHEGHWEDRWHASPYYATMSVVLALADQAGPRAVEAIGGAVRWVLGSQRTDGLWGVWEGTAEETAYALQVLSLTRNLTGDKVDEAIRGGHGALLKCADAHPALWHDKDLYAPTAIISAAVLAASWSPRS